MSRIVQRMRRSLSDRLWEKVDRSGGPDACWPFTPMKHNYYGTIGFTQPDGIVKNIGTHRAAYLVTYGILSDDYMVLHKPICNGNKRCCNPAHLYLGTAQDNALDAIAHGVWQPYQRKLTDEEVYTIRALYGHYSQIELSEQFDVTLTTISDILLGKVRQDAGGPLKHTPKYTKSHCHKGHPLTEDNIVLSHGGKNRNCRLCYETTQMAKDQRRRAALATRGPQPRKKRSDSFLVRFPPETLHAIQAALGIVSYRMLAHQYGTSYTIIAKIAHLTKTPA